MEATTKVSLYNFRIKKNGKYPVKMRVIWQRRFYFYQTGVDLTEEEFKDYYHRKDLRKQFDNIIYYLNKADKIVKDLGRNFSWKEFDALYYNRRQEATKINYNSQSINIVSRLDDYAKKLFDEGSIKTSKGYTTIANHLKDYLKKKKVDCFCILILLQSFLIHSRNIFLK